MRKCTKCNLDKELTEYFKKTKDRYYGECKDCFRCRMRKRTQDQAEFIYNIVGSSCSVCGYDKCDAALELHHIDPSKKEFSISKSRSYGREKILSEIHKCVLLCANCHREVHSGVLILDR